jgi:hypothetical protein
VVQGHIAENIVMDSLNHIHNFLVSYLPDRPSIYTGNPVYTFDHLEWLRLQELLQYNQQMLLESLLRQLEIEESIRLEAMSNTSTIILENNTFEDSNEFPTLRRYPEN